MRFRQSVRLACATAAATVFVTVGLGAITPFETDVSTAIDRGIEWLANQGVYNNPSTQGNDGAQGLAVEALLEKRASGNPGDPAQGYSGANATDQGRLRTAVAFILDRVNETSFYAYRDGQQMFALTEYALSGGPDKSALESALVIPVAPAGDYQTIKQAMDAMVDRTLLNQRKAPTYPLPADQGYWCYTANNCEDSSTTQFAAAGLAAAKSFYSSAVIGDAPYADPARVALIDTALALTKQAYEVNARQGSDYGTTVNGNCQVMSATERGHGYSTSYAPSLTQTASGVYIQLFGGSNVNTPMVQNYVEWLRNRYRYADLDSLGNSWPTASWAYYMWSSFKGMELIRQSGVVPTGLGPNDLGTLPAGTAAAGDCAVRQTHKVTAAEARPVNFGAGGVGFYAGESQSQYFDYAHEILKHQCYDLALPINGSDGNFACNSVPGDWGGTGGHVAHQSYLLLVLQRATGGGCVDSDGDNVCDNVDNCPSVANANQADTYGDKRGDACEPPPTIKLNAATAPGYGTAGVSNINVTGALWPAGAYGPADVTIFIGTSCKGASPVEVKADKLVTILGATRRATFKIPALTPAGPSFVWLSGPGFSSTNCSTLTVN